MTSATTDEIRRKIKAAAGPQARANRVIAAWLLMMCALVVLMVLVGGATRLTDSGLSITEWKPVTGIAPPLDDAAWQAEFEKYKQIPEYELVNQGMSLAEFKTIYWWEWGHRLLGRLIGVAFIIPLIYFFARGWVGARLGWKLAGLFVLGGAQGALGWYMVQSGLSGRVDVSQYRLAAHLGLAVILYAALFWTALDLRRDRQGRFQMTGLGWGGLALALAVYVQIILGAFVAGLRAGKTYTTWPHMDGRFFPDGYFAGPPRLADLFETIAAVQFNHRIGAYLLVIAGILYFAAARRSGAWATEGRARIVLGAILAQMVLGIATLLAATPIALGLLHQAGAIAVLSAALYAAHGSRILKSGFVGSSSSA